MRYSLLAIALFFMPSAMSAHPDHSTGASVGLLHYLADPFHLSMAAAGVLVLVAVLGGLRRNRMARPR